jgi:CubicO group peptidase (beta-lactamase class C family)
MKVMITPEDVGLSSPRLGRIRPWIRAYLDAGKLPGATIFVARHGKAAYCESFGFVDLEAKKPMNADAILRFYSMTKPITAVALMMLYEQGLFHASLYFRRRR